MQILTASGLANVTARSSKKSIFSTSQSKATGSTSYVKVSLPKGLDTSAFDPTTKPLFTYPAAAVHEFGHMLGLMDEYSCLSKAASDKLLEFNLSSCRATAVGELQSGWPTGHGHRGQSRRGPTEVHQVLRESTRGASPLRTAFDQCDVVRIGVPPLPLRDALGGHRGDDAGSHERRRLVNRQGLVPCARGSGNCYPETPWQLPLPNRLPGRTRIAASTRGHAAGRRGELLPLSGNATGVELLLFESAVSTSRCNRSTRSVTNKTFHFWHVLVKGLKAGAHYAYRVDGPSNPNAGHRFNPNKVLIDPYARGNTDDLWNRAAACTPEDNVATSMRSVVIDPAGYDWEGDTPLDRPIAETIMYEMHVRGFTQSPSSGVRASGHVRRHHREDPLPQGPGRDRRRTPAGIRFRRDRRAARPWTASPCTTSGATAR